MAPWQRQLATANQVCAMISPLQLQAPPQGKKKHPKIDPIQINVIKQKKTRVKDI
jgi:hypothetical protein